MLTDFFIPLVSIAIAELGDKTQVSVLLLAAKTEKHFQLLIGVMAAFFIVDGAAILFSTWLIKVVPLATLKIVSGVIFILFGIMMLLARKDEDGRDLKLANPLVSGFGLIFVSELGDKTQIASGLFALKYNPWLVLAGTMAALGLLSVMAVYLGRLISDRIDGSAMTKVAAVIFIILGITFFFT